MDSVRVVISAPGELSPTGPAMVAAVVVPAGGTYYNLNEPQWAPLRGAIDRSIPLMMTAEGMNLGYRFGIQGSGMAADPSMTVYGPTPAAMCGSILANTRLPLPEIAPVQARGLAVTPYGTSATATLRIWATPSKQQ